jgi:alkaline phosphatase
MAFPGGGDELKTLLEYYQEHGKSTGLVTTTYMTHATPAAFGAHEPSRSYTDNIADDYLYQTKPEILFGGGAHGLSISSAISAGYIVVTDAAGLHTLGADSEIMASGQFGNSHLPYEYDGLGSLPHLSEMTVVALDILDNDPDGFFLMVEGGRIDHAGHSHDIKRNIHETIEFGNAVQEVVDWATGRADTLIMVTADHETGGLTVTKNNGAGNYPSVTWSTENHTASDVPVYAWGANARFVSGIIDNTQIFVIATMPVPIEIPMRLTPQVLNPDSQGNWLKAHLILPDGISAEDVDINTPVKIWPLGIESDHMNVFINEDGLVEIKAAFSRSDFCGSATSNDATEVMVIGLLTSGGNFYGTDTIRIMDRSFEYLAVFAPHWLEADCASPDWCSGLDLNQDSGVDFVDYAFLDGCCIEVVDD